MSFIRRRLAVLFLLAAAACQRGASPASAPFIHDVQPMGGLRSVAAQMRIHGGNFFVRAGDSLGGGGASADGQFTATLGDVPIAVERLEDGELRASIPAGLPAGIYDLTVTSPFGLTAGLRGAWTASDFTPAQLGGVATVVSTVSTGQAFDLTLAVRNSGGTSALAVSAGGPGASCTGATATQAISGGASGNFVWHCVAGEPGVLEVTFAVSGTDAVSGQPIAPAEAILARWQIVQRSSLAAAPLAPPATAETGQLLSFALAVTNTGRATARAVTFPTPTSSGTATLELVSAPGAEDVPGSAQRDFIWTLRATAAGSIALVASGGAGTDENDGLPVAVPRSSWPVELVVTPAQLQAEAVASRAQVSVGQRLEVRVRVANAGLEDASAVSVALQQSGVATLAIEVAPQVATVAGGAAVDFVFGLRAVSAGGVALSFSASGQDALSLAAVLASASSALVIQTPPALSETATASPAQVSTGQTITLRLDVTNAGEATAASVLPVATGARLVQTPPAQELPGGATRTFFWSAVADASGPVTFSLTGAGTDVNSGAAAQLPALASNTIAATTPAALSTTAALDHAQVSVGEPFVLQVTVHNGGGGAATGVRCATPSTTGAGTVSLQASPAPQDIAANGSATFLWSYTATGKGALDLATIATGTDANSGVQIQSAAATPASLTVQTQAVLSGTAALVPARASKGQLVALQLDVTNGGDATATAVTPGAATVTTGTASQQTAPAAQDIAGHAKARFTWTFVAGATGSLQISTSASGTDGNSALAVSTGAVLANASVQSAPALSGAARLSLVQASIGQTLTLFLDVTNAGEATAVAFTPAAPGASSGAAQVTASPAAADVPGKSTVTFQWTIAAQVSGAVDFSLSGTGTDGNGAGPVALTSIISPSLLVQRPAQLSASARLSTSSADVGQDFQLLLDVTNAGEATATNVVPSVPVATGTAVGTLSAQPTSQTVLGNNTTVTFSWTFHSTGAGTAGFSAGATGSDANSGLRVDTGTATSPSIDVVVPASLSATLSAGPSPINQSGAITVTLNVTNTGGAAAKDVLPTLTITGGATLVNPAQQSVQVIGAGKTGSFSWTYRGDTLGTATFAATVAGTDTNTSAPLSANAGSAAVIVQRRAALAGVFSLPAAVDQGQDFTVTLKVSNAGDSAANAVTPLSPALSGSGSILLLATPALSSATIAGGSSAAFSWQYRATSLGTVTLSGGASGTDAVDSGSVSTPAVTSVPLQIQAPAALSASASVSLAQLNVGQTALFTLHVANTGGAQANAVTGTVPVLGGAGTLSLVSSPVPQAIGAGASFDFVWTYQATAAGSVTLSAGASGTDDNTGSAVVAASAQASLLVQTAALLSASLTAPSTANQGDTITISFAVINSGGATALGVKPAALSSGGVGATLLSGPLPASADVPGGATQIFAWTYGVPTKGSVTFSGSAAGTDANSRAAVPASAGPIQVVVQAGAALAAVCSAPASANQGQNFTVTLTVTNSGVSAALTVAPSALTLAGLGSATLVSGPSPATATITGGNAVAFTWQFTGGVQGPVTFTGAATGVDAVDQRAVSAPSATSGAVQIQAAAVLVATAATSLASVDVGQTFTFTLHVTNTGGGDAKSVTPSAPLLTGTASVSLTTSPGKHDIAGGASFDFVWTFTATGPGTLTLNAGASATDPNSGNSISVPPASASLLVQTPAALAAVTSAPAVANQGDAITLSLTVSNTGGSTAQSVKPAAPVVGGAGATLLSGPLPASANIAGAAAQTFSWTFRAATLGTVTFSGTASGTDANTAAAVSATSPAANMRVQLPATLGLSLTVPVVAVNVGQSFTVTLVASNAGASNANAVTPSALLVSGAGSASAPAPASAVVAGQGSQSFAYQCTGTAAGKLGFSGTAAGSDAVNGSALSASVTSTQVTVQTPSALTASLVIPLGIALADVFTAALTVTNTGDAAAQALVPTIAASGTATVTQASGPLPAAPFMLAGHSSQTFAWTFAATGEGSLQLSAQASAVDATDGTARTATATSAAAPVAEVVQVASNPFGDGTPFSFLFEYTGQLWLGPSQSGAGAVSMNADGSGAQTVPWQLEHDAGASNSFYAGKPSRTIGARGCAANTASCGPDNESGRALFFSGVVAGTEWLGVAGAHTNGGTDYARFVYFSSPGFPLAAGAIDLAYSDLVSSPYLSQSTRGATAAAVFHDRVYLGFQDAGGALVEALGALPTLPGTQAKNGSDLNDMGARNMTGVGGGSGIDSMTVFGAPASDAIYLANGNGLTRSLNSTPTRCGCVLFLCLTCPDWTDATPSDSRWSNRISITTAKTSDLEPADRAVAAMVTFKGRLFAARNTTSGPQLWSCAPTQSGGQCGPADWSLVAANTVGDNKESQFNDINNAAMTLLAATPQHLYVGFNNLVRGLVVYRTANAILPAMSDFTGRLGCAASASGCAGFGGDGLGAGLTRIYDGKALSFGGRDYLYAAAGTGVAPVRVFRAAQ